MRTYDPADRIRYVHLAQETPAPAAAADTRGACDPLPAGYANLSPATRLGPATGPADGSSARPALVVLPGGAAPTAGSPAAPALRLA
jgi:hypothetical protein